MKTLNIVLLLISFICVGQIQNGRIEYGINIEMPVELQAPNSFKTSYSEAIENAKYLNFTLVFNQETSIFSIIDAIGRDDQGYFYAKLFSGYKGEVYQNKEGSLSVLGGEFGNYILKKKSNEWELINETKEIEGFLCYKAASTKTVVNSKGTFQFPVIAWYCPKIPFSYGPNGYGDLPGLILELQVRNVVFGIKKMDLNLDKEPIIPKIKEYKMITEKELNEIIDKNKNSFKKPKDKF
jgi:GLPGLI family protein